MKFDHHALMHGRDYAGQDVRGWLAQEKFDGFRALWDGEKLVSRQGEKFLAPKWFTEGLPNTPLDGELYLGRGRLSELNGMVWNRESPLWNFAFFVVFDAPLMSGGISQRISSIPMSVFFNGPVFFAPLFEIKEDIAKRLTELIETGGEGLMLREPSAPYKRGRTSTLLKLKSVQSLPASFASSDSTNALMS